jgi:hypothetical protein
MRSTFLISLPLTLGIIAATALPLCGQMFRCGCTFSGATNCNIHHAMAPHCPWCVQSHKAFVLSFLAILPAATGVVYASARRRKSILTSTFLGTAAYLTTALIAGFITAKALNHPTWFGWNL